MKVVTGMGGLYGFHDGLTQWLDWERRLSAYGKLPVGEQGFAMNLDPCFDEFCFGRWDAAAQQAAVKNREGGILPLVLRVDVGKAMSLVIEEVQVDDDAVKHTVHRHIHCSFLLA